MFGEKCQRANHEMCPHRKSKWKYVWSDTDTNAERCNFVCLHTFNCLKDQSSVYASIYMKSCQY